jgi:N-acetylneuraminate lyase
MSDRKDLIAAPFTPMYPDGSINLEMIEPLYRTYKNNKIAGAFINGSTGEGLSLSTNERKELAETWSEVIDDDFKLLLHVGHASISEAKELAQHASDLNISGISTVGPFYAKPVRVEDLVEFCREIALCAPSMPFYYYHIPELTGVHFSMTDFLPMAVEEIPSFKGVKFTDDDLIYFYQSQELVKDNVEFYFGSDELLICGLLLGADGFVGSTYNYMPHLYYEIMQAFNNGDLERARELQGSSMKIAQIIGSYGYSGAAKAVMSHLGLDLGPVRLPLKMPTKSEIREMMEELRKTNLEEYAINVDYAMKVD